MPLHPPRYSPEAQPACTRGAAQPRPGGPSPHTQEAEGGCGPKTRPHGHPQSQRCQEAPRRGAGTSPSRFPGDVLLKNKAEGWEWQ